MQVWQLQEAKSKLTQLIKEAKLTPQIISRYGVNETIVMSIEQYLELVGKDEDIMSFFQNSPLIELDLDLKRDSSYIRDIIL